VCKISVVPTPKVFVGAFGMCGVPGKGVAFGTGVKGPVGTNPGGSWSWCKIIGAGWPEVIGTIIGRVGVLVGMSRGRSGNGVVECASAGLRRPPKE
jgi:hypothetical protein